MVEGRKCFIYSHMASVAQWQKEGNVLFIVIWHQQLSGRIYSHMALVAQWQKEGNVLFIVIWHWQLSGRRKEMFYLQSYGISSSVVEGRKCLFIVIWHQQLSGRRKEMFYLQSYGIGSSVVECIVIWHWQLSGRRKEMFYLQSYGISSSVVEGRKCFIYSRMASVAQWQKEMFYLQPYGTVHSDQSFLQWTHLAINCSSQCPTAGVISHGMYCPVCGMVDIKIP